MRLPLLLATTLLILSWNTWENDFDKAIQKASTEHKFVLLNFSGSDWCGPCIRLRTEIFESGAFQSYADSNLVLVNADFPRLRKNRLSDEQQKKNDRLADKYNEQGIFPCTLLFNSDGKLLRRWDGLPPLSPEAFVAQIKQSTHGH